MRKYTKTSESQAVKENILLFFMETLQHPAMKFFMEEKYPTKCDDYYTHTHIDTTYTHTHTKIIFMGLCSALKMKNLLLKILYSIHQKK